MHEIKNIIFICTDQQRKDSLGCYGHPSAETPHLDALAESGIRFEHNIVANPVCMPSRLSMITGMYPRNHRLWTNGVFVDPLPLTLPEHLHKQGWKTASIGKLHHTPTGADGESWESRKRWQKIAEAGGGAYSDTGPYAGYEHVELTIGHGGGAHAHHGAWFYKNGGQPEMLEWKHRDDAHDSGYRGMPVSLHHSTFVAERSCAYLDSLRGDSAPFFLHVSFPDPHHPFDPPEEATLSVDPQLEPEPVALNDSLDSRPAHYRQRQCGQWSRKGSVERDAERWAAEAIRTVRARTTAMVQLIDEGVGKVVAKLDELGIRDQTLIVFTSDHGDALGDHGIFGKGPWGYRSIINTPLIVAGAGLDGGVSEKLVSDVDLAPTLCELVGAAPLPDADGISLAAHFHDLSQPTREAAFIESRNGFGPSDYASIARVTETTTYIQYEDGVEELTDLLEDPEERNNVAAEREHQCQEYRADLLKHLLSSQTDLPRQISNA